MVSCGPLTKRDGPSTSADFLSAHNDNTKSAIRISKTMGTRRKENSAYDLFTAVMQTPVLDKHPDQATGNALPIIQDVDLQCVEQIRHPIKLVLIDYVRLSLMNM